MMCHCRFEDCNKCTTLEGRGIDCGGSCGSGRGQGIYGNSLYSLLNLTMNLKLL